MEKISGTGRSLSETLWVVIGEGLLLFGLHLGHGSPGTLTKSPGSTKAPNVYRCHPPPQFLLLSSAGTKVGIAKHDEFPKLPSKRKAAITCKWRRFTSLLLRRGSCPVAGAGHGDSELKVQDNVSRNESPKLCHSFTSSTELAWVPTHRGQELQTSSRQNTRATDVPGQKQLDCDHI